MPMVSYFYITQAVLRLGVTDSRFHLFPAIAPTLPKGNKNIKSLCISLSEDGENHHPQKHYPQRQVTRFLMSPLCTGAPVPPCLVTPRATCPVLTWFILQASDKKKTYMSDSSTLSLNRLVLSVSLRSPELKTGNFQYEFCSLSNRFWVCVNTCVLFFTHRWRHKYFQSL